MQPTRYDAALFWFRRDLRDYDNAGLSEALQAARKVYCAFVFDREILDALPRAYDRRVDFIWRSIHELAAGLRELGGGLVLRHGKASEEIPRLAAQLKVGAVFTNRDYEPAAVARDAKVAKALREQGIAFYARKDQVVSECDEVLAQSGRPLTVFTPYRNAWLKRLDDAALAAHPVEAYRERLAAPPGPAERLSLADLGFEPTNIGELLPAGMSGAQTLFLDFQGRMAGYAEARDFPALKGVSYLSVHQRFGTVSIRELVRVARSRASRGASAWLSELIWREFYFQIVHHFPHVVGHAFKTQYDGLSWENDESKFRSWCEARTGYPIVDAAMCQINQTGYMHNRLRMIVASFLTKDLLIDWRWGERYFAEHLNDFDLAANNGGWQWAASTGCDAQPYFRIFNPVTQSEKFDAQGAFIRRYLPELNLVSDRFIHAPWTMGTAEQKRCGVIIGKDYPSPIVDHAVARNRALEMYRRTRPRH
jgi:deoxyribodipyrimidine photo-lyase